MEDIGVLLMCPISPYIEQELDKRFKVFRFWNFPQKEEFFKLHSHSIRAVVGTGRICADSELVDSLPALEIVTCHGVGVDKIDLVKCRERGIRVTDTAARNTDEVADLGIALILATLRKICACDRFVQSGFWKKGDFELTSKVHLQSSSSAPAVGIRPPFR